MILFKRGQLISDELEEAVVIIQAQLADGKTYNDLVVLQQVGEQLHYLTSLTLPSSIEIRNIFINDAEIEVQPISEDSDQTADSLRYHLVEGRLQLARGN